MLCPWKKKIEVIKNNRNTEILLSGLHYLSMTCLVLIDQISISPLTLAVAK